MDRPWLASYPEGVPGSLAPYPSTSVYALFEDAATRHPGAVATAFFGKHVTYRELVRQVDQFGRVLTSLGVGRGDRVGLVLPNCPQYVIAYYAALRIGAIVVGNNPLYTERELSHQLKDAGIEVCVTLDVLYPKVAEVRDAVGLREVIVGKVTDYMPFPVDRLAPRTLKKHALAAGEPW